MFRRRNLYLKRLQLLHANPTKRFTRRQRRWFKGKNRVFSTLTRKSYARRVVLRAKMSPTEADRRWVWHRAHPMVYPVYTWKYHYKRPKWYWMNPAAVPGVIKVQKLKFLALHQRYTMSVLKRWLHYRSGTTWVRWLQQLRWNQWAWMQRLEALPHILLAKVGWFNHSKEAITWVKCHGVQWNSFPRGPLPMKTHLTQPGDLWRFASVSDYHPHLIRQCGLWVEVWSAPMKNSCAIYV